MNINDKTIAHISVGLLLAILLAVARMSWTVSEINTKVEALWSAHMPLIASTTPAKANP